MKLHLNRKRPRIEIVPMIDVMFFMLVFFLLFSTLKTAQLGVPVDLPTAVHLGKPEQNTVVVSIDKESRVYYGKKPYDLKTLGMVVAMELQKDPQTKVIVKPDAIVPYNVLVKVMDSLAEAGVTKPLLGVDREQMPKNKG